LEKGENRKKQLEKARKTLQWPCFQFSCAQCGSSVLQLSVAAQCCTDKSKKVGGKEGGRKKLEMAEKILVCVGPVLQQRKECPFKIKNQNQNTCRRQKRRCNARATDLRWPVVVGVVAAAVAGVVAAAVGVA